MNLLGPITSTNEGDQLMLRLEKRRARLQQAQGPFCGWALDTATREFPKPKLCGRN